jgi:ribose transport system substrate-binding protein
MRRMVRRRGRRISLGFVVLVVVAAAAASAATSAKKPPVLIDVPTTGKMVDTSKYKKGPPWTLGYSDASLSNSARVFMWQFIQETAAKYPQIKGIIRTDANDSQAKQVSDIEDLLSKNVDCLIVAATNDKAINPAIDQAMSRGVPVVIDERDVTTDNYVVFASLRSENIGLLTAKAIAKRLKGKGNIVALAGLPGVGVSEDTVTAWKKVLKGYPGIKLLDLQYTDYSPTKAQTIMENMLQAHKKIDGVLSDSGIQSVAAYQAAQAAGRAKQIKAWTGDELQSWMRFIKKYNIPADVVVRPIHVATLTVHACVGILSGQSMPKEWPEPVYQIPNLKRDINKYIVPASIKGSDQWWDFWKMSPKWRPK